jgi:acylphosphatase
LAVEEKQSARRFIVSGMVQGVGFRYFAQHAAHRLGVAGFVRNLRDGSVEVYASGPPSTLAAFKSELERGPRSAHVSNVSEEPTDLDPRFAEGFSIEFDAGW